MLRYSADGVYVCFCLKGLCGIVVSIFDLFSPSKDLFMHYILVTQKSIHIELYKNKFIFCILKKNQNGNWSIRLPATATQLQEFWIEKDKIASFWVMPLNINENHNSNTSYNYTCVQQSLKIWDKLVVLILRNHVNQSRNCIFGKSVFRKMCLEVASYTPLLSSLIGIFSGDREICTNK